MTDLNNMYVKFKEIKKPQTNIRLLITYGTISELSNRCKIIKLIENVLQDTELKLASNSCTDIDDNNLNLHWLPVIIDRIQEIPGAYCLINLLDVKRGNSISFTWETKLTDTKLTDKKIEKLFKYIFDKLSSSSRGAPYVISMSVEQDDIEFGENDDAYVITHLAYTNQFKIKSQDGVPSDLHIDFIFDLNDKLDSIKKIARKLSIAPCMNRYYFYAIIDVLSDLDPIEY